MAGFGSQRSRPVATFLTVIVAALVALGYFDGVRGPRVQLTFAATKPRCRRSDSDSDGGGGLWIRVAGERHRPP